MKKLLFVGAGVYQLPGIRKANEEGYVTIAIDGDPKAIGLQEANLGKHLNILDKELCLKFAKEHEIDGVLTIASDVAVPTVAYIAEQMHLPGISTNTAEVSTNKYLQRQKMIEAGIKCPIFEIVGSEEELNDALNKFQYPVVIKPIDSAGSRGVFYVDTDEKLYSSFPTSMRYSKVKKVIIEEFIDGFEVSIEAFSCFGETKIIALSRKERTAPPHMLDTSVTFPAQLSEDMIEKVKKIGIATIKAIGIDHAPIHLELLISPNEEVVPVELAARGPGFKVFTDIIPYVTGVDVLKASLDLALGKKPDLQITQNKAASVVFLEAIDGFVEEIRGVEIARAYPEVYDLDIYVKRGDKTRKLSSGQDRVGHVIVFGNHAGEVLTRAKEIGEMITFDTK